MKKLMITMMAAVATAFGLSATPISGTGFNESTLSANAKVTPEGGGDAAFAYPLTLNVNLADDQDPTAQTPSTYWEYAGAANGLAEDIEITQWAQDAGKPETSSGITTETNDNFLKIETDGNNQLKRYINSGKTGVDMGEGTTRLFLDTLVQFTAADSETPPTPGDGEKLVVYMEEVEAQDAVPAVGEEGQAGYVPAVPAVDPATNLCVIAGASKTKYILSKYWNSINDTTATGDFKAEAGKWYRLTIQSFKDIGDGVPGFAIFVDGKLLGTGSGSGTGAYAPKGAAFASCDPDSLTATSIQYAGFEGSGAIDEIYFTDAPNGEFWLGNYQIAVTVVGEATSVSYKIGDAAEQTLTLTEGAGTITGIAPGSTVTVTAVAADNKIIKYNGADSYSATINSDGELTITILDKKVDVGGTAYASFAEGLAEVQKNGGTLKLLDNMTLAKTEGNESEATFTEGDIILDLAGKTLTGPAGVAVVKNDGANLTITNSTEIIGSIVPATDCDAVSVVGEEGQVAITAGKIDGAIDIEDYDGDDPLIITGGSFKDDSGVEFPYEDALFAGEAIVGDLETSYAEGYWTVTPAAEPEPAKPFAIIIAGEPVTTNKYDTLAEAVTAATAGQTITMMADAVTDDMVEIAKEVMLDLNGKTLSAAGLVYPDDAVIAVKHGGSLTVMDSVGTGVIDGTANSTQYAGIKMTMVGDTIPDESYSDSNKATLVVNGGTIKGYNYAIVGNGNPNRGNCDVTINGGTIQGTCKDDSAGIFFPCYGNLTINGGTIEGAMGVYLKAGRANVAVESGATIVGNGTAAAFVAKGDGFESTGDAFVVDNAGYVGGTPAPVIAGGTFVSSNAAAVASYKQGSNELVGGFVSGGSFKGAGAVVDATLFAEGYELAGTPDENGFYSVAQSAAVIPYSLACLGVTADDTTDTITFTVNTGYENPVVYINGEQQEITGTSFAKPADGAVVISATKVRGTVEHKWWEHPGLVAKTFCASGDGTGFGWGSDGEYLANPTWCGQSAKLWNMHDLFAPNAMCINSFVKDTNSGWYSNEVNSATICNSAEINFYGGAACTKLNVAVYGSECAGKKILSVPLNEPATAENSFIIENSEEVTLSQMTFTDDAQYLYGVAYAPSDKRQYVYKFQILNGLKQSGMGLQKVAEYDFGQRIRASRMAKIGNNEILYAFLEDGTLRAIDTSDNTAETHVITTCPDAVSGCHKYGCFWVSGTKTDAPHITAFWDAGATKQSIIVYELKGNGLELIGNDAIKFELTKGGAGTLDGFIFSDSYGPGIWVSDDEADALIGDSNLFAYQYCPPPTFRVFLVDATSSEAEGVYTFTPAEGYTMSSIFVNGAEVTSGITKNQDGTWEMAKPAAMTGDFDIVAAATKPRSATNKWYESPKGTSSYAVENNSASGDGQGFYKWGFDGEYVAAVDGHGGDHGSISMIKIENAEADVGTLVPEYTVLEKAEAIYGAKVMGAAVSVAQGVALLGNRDGSNPRLISIPLQIPAGKTLAECTAQIATSDGRVPVTMAFTADGKYLYAAFDGTKDIAKYEVTGSLCSDGAALTLVGNWANADISEEVRSASFANVGGKDIAIFTDDGKAVYALDLSDTANTCVSLGITHNKKSATLIIGSHLYIYDNSSTTDTLRIFDIDTTAGIALGETPIKTFSSAEIKAFLGASSWATTSQSEGLAVSADEATLVFGAYYPDGVNKIHIVQYVPQYEVKFVADGVEIATEKVYAGETTTAPATDPVKAGYTFEGWFANETEFDPTAPVMAAATYTAKFTATPFAITIALDGATAPTGWTAGADDGTVVTNYTVETADFALPTLVKDGFNFTGYVKSGETATNLTVTIDCSLGEAAQATYTACFEKAGPVWPETWPKDAGEPTTYAEAFAAWASAYSVTDFAGKEAAFLMNADPTATLPELKIESIEVEGTTATIVVSAGETDLATINGVLYVDSSDDLATWTTEEIDVATAANIDKATGKATFTIEAGKFMKAKVGFTAPTDPSAE